MIRCHYGGTTWVKEGKPIKIIWRVNPMDREYSYVEQTNWHVCQGCGYEREGNEVPDSCPDCGTPDFDICSEPMELKWS